MNEWNYLHPLLYPRKVNRNDPRENDDCHFYQLLKAIYSQKKELLFTTFNDLYSSNIVL